MNNKMKGIIGGVVGLVVVLIIVFSMGSGSITPQQFAKESLVLAEQAVEKIKVAKTKEDIMSIYKETLPPLLDMIPGALAGAKEYIDEKGGADAMIDELKDDPEAFAAKYAKDFEEITGKAITMAATMESLSRDRGFEDRMEKIFKSMTDLDFAELVEFTVPKYASVIEDVANNDEALAALNAYIALVTPEYRRGEDKEVWVDYGEGDGGYYEYKEGKKTKIDPVVLTKEKLLSLSKIIEDSFKGAKTEKELDKAEGKVEKAFKKEFGFRIIDF